MKTGTFLKKQREERKMNRAEAADRVDVAYNTLQNWERDFSTPNSTTLRKLRALYQFDMDEYLEYYKERCLKEAERKVSLLKKRIQ